MKTKNQNQYYVYVYIDPRNYQEFYYGKGTGNRKFAHMKDESDSEKSKIIRAIKSEGLKPIIRIIAKDLTETEAFLVEKTLIWKLGRSLANKSSGRFADKFRPHNTLHKDIFEFDYANGIFYVNVGEGKGETRNWDDCRKYGFLAAGQGWKKWGSKLYTLQVGDIVVAYLKNHGYVGIGRVAASACPVNNFRVNGKPLHSLKLIQPNIYKKNADNQDCDHLVAIDWIASVDRANAKWKAKAGLRSQQQIVATLENQVETLKFLEKNFKVDFELLLNGEKSLKRAA